MSKQYISRAALEAKRTVAKLDRLSVKVVSLVMDRVDPEGELAASDSIKAARDIRARMVKIFADFSRSRTFRKYAK